MPADDGWDWPVLLYIATVILLRPEKEFWRMVPRKLNALLSAHAQVNNPEDDGSGGTSTPDKPKVGFIDQVM